MPSDLYASNQLKFLSPWFEDVSQAKMQSLGLQGSFSGAIVWRVATPTQELCLRRWPQIHPTIDGLTSIHGLLQHIDQTGFHLAPVPLATRYGSTFFQNEDHLWELAPWMPGEANYRQLPSTEKLVAAMTTLADFHLAAATYQDQANIARLAPSPGLQQRLSVLRDLQGGELERLWKETRTAEASDLRELAFELLETIGRPLADVASQVESMVSTPLPMQWCLRDVRHDHLLFTGNQVMGLIDFGAAAVESVAGDLARLIGSMANDSRDCWKVALEAYHQRRQLSVEESRAITAFDAGGTICAAANWVRWLFVEGRSFPQIHALHDQLIWLRDRLTSLSNRAGASVVNPSDIAWLAPSEG